MWMQGNNERRQSMWSKDHPDCLVAGFTCFSVNLSSCIKFYDSCQRDVSGALEKWELELVKQLTDAASADRPTVVLSTPQSEINKYLIKWETVAQSAILYRSDK